MSSSGAIPTNTAPLVLRFDSDNPQSVNNTFVLDKYGNPVTSGSVQLIAPQGQIVYGNALSTLTVSSLTAPNHTASTISITSSLNLTNSAGIIFNNTTNSNLLSTLGDTLYFNGHQVALGTSGDSFWQRDHNAIVNTNFGPVSTTQNLIVASTLTVNSGGANIIGNTIITPAIPTNDDAFKVELNGTNFLVYRDGTTNTVLNNGSGSGNNLVLSSGNTVILNNNTVINGSLKLNSGNSGSPGLYFNTDQDTGLYGISDGEMGISANGQQRIKITNGDINLTPNTDACVSTIGNATITGLLTLNNTLSLTSGGANISGGATINGLLTTNNAITVNGGATINGGATVNGLLTANNAITVNNGATINGLLTANNGANINGNTNIISNTSTISLSLSTNNGYYTMYTSASNSNGSGGLIPSTFQMYSYYTPSVNGSIARQVLTIYPGGRMDILSTLNVTSGGANITGPTQITGTVTTNAIQMTNGTISGVNTINGVAYPPATTQGNIPVGGIIMWSGTSTNLPQGFALCDGGTYTISGGSSRVTPDLRGRFIMGATYATSGTIRYNNTTGPTTLPTDENGTIVPALYTNQSGGEIKHTLTIDEMPAHTHNYSQPIGDDNNGLYGGSYWEPGTTTTSSTGGSQAHNNMPQYYVLAFIMRID
jgi:microcystin-dependent protein